MKYEPCKCFWTCVHTAFFFWAPAFFNCSKCGAILWKKRCSVLSFFLLRKMLVTSTSLFFFFLALTITLTFIFLSPIDHPMHPHPPCSDALMSNKTQIDSKPPRGGVDQDVVVIETRITCSMFPLTLHLSASEHAAIDGTWTPIPIDLSGWNQYILSAHARPTWASRHRWRCLQGRQKHGRSKTDLWPIQLICWRS